MPVHTGPVGADLDRAFQVKSGPLPWRKAIGAPLATLGCLLLGLAFGHFTYGVWAFFGGFTSMYVSTVPYRIRARTLTYVGLGVVASLAVGSSTSASPFLLTVGIGLVAGVSTFVTTALEVPLPGSLMFILIAALGAALPVHPGLTGLRVGFAAAGAAIAWLVGMAGVLWHPGHPERMQLAALYDALGREATGETASPTLPATLRMWRAGSFRDSALMHWLFRAARIRAAIHSAPRTRPALARHLKRVADYLRGQPTRSLVAPPHRWRLKSAQILKPLPGASWLFTQAGPRQRLADALRPGTPALTAGLRTGLAVTLATALVLLLGEPHPYWVPLTVGAILQGPTPGVMMDRAVERVVGTVLGLFLAAGLLALHPTLPATALLMLVLQFLLLILVVRNYALAVIVITTLALVVIEGEVRLPLWPLLTARLIDTALGAAIAAAALFFGAAVRPTGPPARAGPHPAGKRPATGPRPDRNEVRSPPSVLPPTSGRPRE